ncbi:hypothetical protein [Acinetobacter faecalis]|uniref:hypothetical protein n=1 Tax=Acinetobacter faecalis TaxID=2665161 RepID=UPI002A916F29|nr:hypothetical protein [Acinetobacter faecalis]MDY6449475.1 hypothetical protein [Acinetobacter faecalis]
MFIEALANFIKKISSSCELDEWYLSNFIDESVSTLSKSDAFEMSSHLVEVIKKDLESSHMYELLTILLALQSQSDTTQLPLNLSRDPSFLNEIIQSNSEKYIHHLVDELTRNYRIKI